MRQKPMALQKLNHFALKTDLLDEKVVAEMKHIPANFDHELGLCSYAGVNIIPSCF